MQELEAGAIANADEQRQVGHFWLRAPEDAPTMGQAVAIGQTAEDVRAFAEGVRRGAIAAEDGMPFTDVLHIGIGGSALGPALLVDALGPAADDEGTRRSLTLHFIDNTDPDGIARTLAAIGDDLRHTLVVVGEQVRWHRRDAQRHDAGARRREAGRPELVEPGGGHHGRGQQAAHPRQGRDLASYLLHVGLGRAGRFSVTSAVGLLPGELAGIDTLELLEGARDMDTWTSNPDGSDNPAALLAGVWYVAGAGRGDRALVVLPYRDRLHLLSRYLQQLVMESLGKQLDRSGREVWQGLTVYGNKGSTDQHAYVQQLRDGRDDVLTTLITVLDDGRG